MIAEMYFLIHTLMLDLFSCACLMDKVDVLRHRPKQSPHEDLSLTSSSSSFQFYFFWDNELPLALCLCILWMAISTCFFVSCCMLAQMLAGCGRQLAALW